MKKLISLVLTLALGSAMAFSQEAKYLSLIKKSIDTLSVQLQNKERERSYLIMDAVVKEFSREALIIDATFFGKYFNEIYANSNPELKKAYEDYQIVNREYNNYKTKDRAYINILALPSRTQEQIKVRNKKFSELHYKRFRNDPVYKKLLNNNTGAVKRYHNLALAYLLSTYKSRNEIFPVSSLNIQKFISDMTEFNPSILSLDAEINNIKMMAQQMTSNLVRKEMEQFVYTSEMFRRIDSAQKKSIDSVSIIPAQIRDLELKLADLNQKYSDLMFKKYLDMRIADSASIPVFTIPLAKNNDYINSVDSLRLLKEAFDKKNDVLSAVLESDSEYSALKKKAENYEISGEDYISESSFIMSRKFKENKVYIKARQERERSLFRSNIAILRHLIKTYSDDKLFLDYDKLLGTERPQIETHPELYMLKFEINSIKSFIGTTWNKYYRLRFGVPAITSSGKVYVGVQYL